MSVKDQLVAAIKENQKNTPGFKDQWWEYCDSNLGGTRDPNRHDEADLQAFLESIGAEVEIGQKKPQSIRKAPRAQTTVPTGKGASAWGGGGKGASQWAGAGKGGSAWGNGNGAGGKGAWGGISMGPFAGAAAGFAAPQGGNSEELTVFVKTGQKSSGNFKNAWAEYCSMYGGGINDPTRHDASHITGFIDYLGQLAVQDFSGDAAFAAPAPAAVPRVPAPSRGKGATRGGGAIGAPVAKRAKTEPAPSVADDPLKADLVARVKEFQRRSPEDKQTWWEFCDSNHGGVKDPARHGEDVLTEFLLTVEA